MDIDITEFIRNENPRDYSASVSELGKDAGKIIWDAALRADHRFITEDNRKEFIEWIIGYGGWNEDALRASPLNELNALFIQWVAGDMRDMGIGGEPDDKEWRSIEKLQREGIYPSNIYRQDGRFYFGIVA